MIGRYPAGALRQRGRRGVVARILLLGLLPIIGRAMIVGTIEVLYG
jgi:hypothetical protein